jgi:hypothetical protein
MMMKCISREEGIQLLWDIHNGICESHLSWCSIIRKAFKHGFYWPTAKDDVMEIITKCWDCQFFQKHANPLQPIDLSCPFAIWGIDFVAFYLGHQEVLDFYLSPLTHLHVDGSYASSKYHTRSNSQIPAEYHIQVQRTQVGPHS